VNGLPFEDRADFEDAGRGLIGSLDPGVVKDASGRVVWDNDAFAFLQGDCPETANPSLWRQSRLCARQGLFEVTGGIYQVRGLDLSNMTIVEGDRGVIVIDPLISTETAAAALALYRQHGGDRPVTGVPVAPLWVIRGGSDDLGAGLVTDVMMACTVLAQLSMRRTLPGLGWRWTLVLGSGLLGLPAPVCS
jgi:Metallo-beta-lactamase superfamily